MFKSVGSKGTKLIDLLCRFYKQILFIVVALVMTLFFYVHCENSFCGSKDITEPSSTLHLVSGETYRQELVVEDSISITSISLRFGTYVRSNTGTLYVSLNSSEQVIESWEIDVSNLRDNEYYTFNLLSPIKVGEEDKLFIEFCEVYEGDNGIAISVGEQNEAQFYRDDNLIENCGVSYKLGYERTELRLQTIIIATLIFVAVAIMVLVHVNKKIIMSTILIVCGLVYMWICTPGSVPDEPNHFFRAFEVSRGIFVSEHIGENGEGGNHFPVALTLFRDETAELDWNTTVDIPFSNTALYSAISYLPQAAGISIANIFTDNVSALFYAGKWGNFIVAMILCCTALFITPFGERLLLLIMLFPMSLQEMVSMSPDGFVIALSMLFVAYILRLTYQNISIKKIDVFIVAMLSVMISLSKIVYIALLLIIFIIPNKKIGEKRSWIGFKFGIIGGATLINLIWLKISSGYLVEFQPGVDTGAQVLYVLTNIPKYIETIIRTLLENGVWYIQSMFGSHMGPLTINISSIMWMALLVLFVYEIGQTKECSITPRRADRWIILLSFLGGAALICTSLYVQWTPLGNSVVNGIQGRYFTPFIALLGLFVMFTNKEKELDSGINMVIREQPSYYYYILLVANGITILDMINYYC